MVWFDIKKEADWRINSTPKSAQAFKKIMRDPHFNGTGKQLAELKIPPRADVIPARKRAVALKATGKITIDGDISDWSVRIFSVARPRFCDATWISKAESAPCTLRGLALLELEAVGERYLNLILVELAAAKFCFGGAHRE
jgi:hypothetical protein